MKIKVFEFNPIQENTYIVYDDTNECVIIDPGCYFSEEKELLLNFILDKELIVKHLINTHLHFDHVFGCSFVTEQFNVVLEANKDDQILLDSYADTLKAFGLKSTGETPVIGKHLDEGDKVEFGKQRFSIFKVPGHSPGSVVFYNENNSVLFGGDVLFRGSVGRTDFPYGSHTELIQGIKEKLLILPSETVVYPGHGPTTTIGYEKMNNGYLR